jgi:serine/threonine protein kinase
VVKPAAKGFRHLAPGDKLGKYDLIRQIAIGGMAELYLARTVGIEGFEKLVVVKRMLPQHANNGTFVEMFLNEARLAATLHHPNVAQVYDIGQEQGDYFFAMEYVHGEDLDQIALQANEQGVPLSMDAALTLVAGLCAGLHYAHDKVGADGRPLEIVHRDVSPSNVLVSYDGAVKLVDFGIARMAKRPTTRGGLKGKIAYMSPEQCRSSGSLDRRSDVFSVGMILYELTAGQLPFAGETEYQLLDQIVNTDAPAPSVFVPGFPPALERIVLRALARDRNQRYASALELQGALEDFAHENRLRVSPLVLARLMSSLFPARLEEWAHAKAQGAFFVEQHVVRTLIEDGKTPAPPDAGLQEAIPASEEDQTAVDTDVTSDTAVEKRPLGEQTGPTPEPLPRPPTVPTRTTPPRIAVPASLPPARSSPRAATKKDKPVLRTPIPGAVPIIAMAPGTIVSSSTSNQPPGSPASRTTPVARSTPVPGTLPPARNTPGTLPLPPPVATPPVATPVATPAVPVEASSTVGDVTERVRLPRRPSSSTTHVRVEGRRRSPLPWIGGLVVLAGGIAAAIAFLGGSTTAPAAIDKAPPAVESPKVEAPAAAEVESPKVEAPAAAEVETPAAPPAAAEVETPASPPAAVPVEANDGPANDAPPKVAAPVANDDPPKVAAPVANDDPPKRAPPVANDAPSKVAPPKAAPPPVATPAKAPPRRVVRRPVVRKKPATSKPEPKETNAWNADSPFMPVRTDKH